MEITRKCSHCKNTKPIDQFVKDANKPLGRRYVCKPCFSIYLKSQKHKDIVRRSKIKRKVHVLWFYAMKRALKKNIEFTIKEEDIVIPDVCPVLGIPIMKDCMKMCDNSPSIDRIDVSKGYTKENVCVISLRANMIKNCGSVDEHAKIVEYMKTHGCV